MTTSCWPGPRGVRPPKSCCARSDRRCRHTSRPRSLEPRYEVEALVDEIAAVGFAEDATLVVEGVGGLLVPLGDGWDVRRLAAAVGLPVLIAARPGLGTINHTLLTLEAARAGGLRIAGVVLTPWPERPDEVARSNLETIERLGGVEVATLPRVAADPVLLASAGAALPLERWLSDRS